MVSFHAYSAKKRSRRRRDGGGGDACEAAPGIVTGRHDFRFSLHLFTFGIKKNQVKLMAEGSIPN